LNAQLIKKKWPKIRRIISEDDPKYSDLARNFKNYNRKREKEFWKVYQRIIEECNLQKFRKRKMKKEADKENNDEEERGRRPGFHVSSGKNSEREGKFRQFS
jgi:hypothetical protein